MVAFFLNAESQTFRPSLFRFRRCAHLWNILHETCFLNILHATYLQLSTHQGNIFQAICCILSIWINEKHNNNVRSYASFPHATQLISLMKHIASFTVCAVPLKYIDLLRHTNISCNMFQAICFTGVCCALRSVFIARYTLFVVICEQRQNHFFVKKFEFCKTQRKEVYTLFVIDPSFRERV